ncbi:MAG: SpoIIE family protein phosphatase, partial [Deltaproteobacteria bacterium]|nr:SpoIIE family protein phosphatase [Deltaproteobacteria bacterium]
TALVVADCTGHGIPGAFMTLISTTILDRIASRHDLSHPDHILDQLDELMSQTFKLNTGDSTSFGLDCGVCCFSREEGILRFAGAKSNLYQKMGEDLREMRGDRVSLGYDSKQHPIPFNVVETSLDEKSSFYLFSDGITDQIGEEKKLMYGKKSFCGKFNRQYPLPRPLKGS